MNFIKKAIIVSLFTYLSFLALRYFFTFTKKTDTPVKEQVVVDSKTESEIIIEEVVVEETQENNGATKEPSEKTHHNIIPEDLLKLKKTFGKISFLLASTSIQPQPSIKEEDQNTTPSTNIQTTEAIDKEEILAKLQAKAAARERLSRYPDSYRELESSRQEHLKNMNASDKEIAL